MLSSPAAATGGQARPSRAAACAQLPCRCDSRALLRTVSRCPWHAAPAARPAGPRAPLAPAGAGVAVGGPSRAAVALRQPRWAPGRREADSRPLAPTQAAAAPCAAPAAPQRGAVSSSPRSVAAAGSGGAAPAAASAPLQLVTPRASPPPAVAATPSLAEGLAAPAPRRLSASAGAPGVMVAAASPFASFAAPPPQQHAPPPLALGAPRHAAAAASGFVRWHGPVAAAPAVNHSAPSSGGSGGGGSGGDDDDAIAAELLVLRASSPRHDGAGGAHPAPAAHHAHSGLAGTPRRKRAAPDPSKFRGVVERTVRLSALLGLRCFANTRLPCLFTRAVCSARACTTTRSARCRTSSSRRRKRRVAISNAPPIRSVFAQVCPFLICLIRRRRSMTAWRCASRAPAPS